MNGESAYRLKELKRIRANIIDAVKINRMVLNDLNRQKQMISDLQFSLQLQIHQIEKQKAMLKQLSV
ncbi:MAG: hypothetical protein ACOC2K_01795 [Bacteroidota bacterium]